VRRDPAAIALLLGPPLSAALHALFVVRVGGDFMHGRMLLPSLFGVLLPVATVVVGPVRAAAWRTASLQAVVVLVAVGWGVVCATSMRLDYPGAVGPDGIADERGVYVSVARHPNPVAAEDYAAYPGWGAGMELRRRADEQRGQRDAAMRSLERVRTGQGGGSDALPQSDRQRLLVVDASVPLQGYDSNVIPLEPGTAASVTVAGRSSRRASLPSSRGRMS
jgi:hypothetical protein